MQKTFGVSKRPTKLPYLNKKDGRFIKKAEEKLVGPQGSMLNTSRLQQRALSNRNGASRNSIYEHPPVPKPKLDDRSVTVPRQRPTDSKMEVIEERTATG